MTARAKTKTPTPTPIPASAPADRVDVFAGEVGTGIPALGCEVEAVEASLTIVIGVARAIMPGPGLYVKVELPLMIVSKEVPEFAPMREQAFSARP